jgi:hypothetical protein
MRVNAAWHDDAIARFHYARAAGYRQAAWRGDSDDLFASNADFGGADGIGRDDKIAPDHKVHVLISANRLAKA